MDKVTGRGKNKKGTKRVNRKREEIERKNEVRKRNMQEEEKDEL